MKTKESKLVNRLVYVSLLEFIPITAAFKIYTINKTRLKLIRTDLSRSLLTFTSIAAAFQNYTIKKKKCNSNMRIQYHIKKSKITNKTKQKSQNGEYTTLNQHSDYELTQTHR